MLKSEPFQNPICTKVAQNNLIKPISDIQITQINQQYKN